MFNNLVDFITIFIHFYSKCTKSPTGADLMVLDEFPKSRNRVNHTVGLEAEHIYLS